MNKDKLKAFLSPVVDICLVIYRRLRSIFIVYSKGNYAKGTKVIAITGTNGKTSTAGFLNQILKNLGFKTAIYTTVFYEVDGQYYDNKTHMTISSATAVQDFFKKAKKAKVDWVILEVTSHALDQFRVFGVPISIAMVTNLSQDHLDYHETMEKYAQAKARIVRGRETKDVVLNKDDDWFDYFNKATKAKVTTVGREGADIKIGNIEPSNKGTDFDISFGGVRSHFSLPIYGEFNVYNLAFALAGANLITKDFKSVSEATTGISSVKGRLEIVDQGQDFTVMVDYAHTPDAIKNALQAGKQVAKSKLRLVFGATGDRDKAKRIPMGKIAASFADVIYLTDDETYTEDGYSIRKTVLEGIKTQQPNSEVYEIPDRYEAIKKAFIDSKKGDVVILAGIGHEDYRNMGGKKVAWNEVDICKEILKQIKK